MLAVLWPNESEAGRDCLLEVCGVVFVVAAVVLEEVEDGSDVVELRPGAQPPGAADAELALGCFVQLRIRVTIN